VPPVLVVKECNPEVTKLVVHGLLKFEAQLNWIFWLLSGAKLMVNAYVFWSGEHKDCNIGLCQARAMPAMPRVTITDTMGMYFLILFFSDI